MDTALPIPRGLRMIQALVRKGRMDLGFAIRQRGQRNRPDAPQALARLLAEISARQAVSPTAKAQIRANAPSDPPENESSAIAAFAPDAAQHISAAQSASFNSEIAEAILEQRKSL